MVPDDAAQTVVTLVKAHRLRGKVHPHARWRTQHGVAARRRNSTRVEHLLGAKATQVLFEVANVAWDGAPFQIPDLLVVGSGTRRFESALRHVGAHTFPPLSLTDHSTSDVGAEPLLFAALVNSPDQRARHEAEGRFAILVNLALLLTPDLAAQDLWSLRGDLTRPGIRGLKIHRRTLSNSSDVQVKRELSGEIVHSGAPGKSRSHNWFDDTPVPLRMLVRASGMPRRLRQLIPGTFRS